MNRYDDARRVFDALSQTLVDVRLVADVPDLAGLSLTTTQLHGMPVIGLRESPHFGLNVVVKRAMDVIFAQCRPRGARPADGVHRGAGEADEPRPGLLPPGAVRAERPVVPDAQVPHACGSTPRTNGPQ